jgi:hypothetical protein
MKHLRIILCTLVTVLLLPIAPASAGGSLATVDIGASGVEWFPQAGGYDHLVLTVSGPGDFYLRQKVEAGAVPTLSLFDAQGQSLPDGSYSWELTAVPKVSAELRAAMAEARQSGHETALAGQLPQGDRQTGFLSISGGQFVSPEGVREPAPAVRNNDFAGGGGASPEASILANADGVIRNSLCVGFDCPNSPTFSDTTILLMENNTRIKFDDTSTINSFPRNDWEIEANSNLNGGASYLGFNDCGQSSQGGCATDLVFAVEAGARSSALYVESDGDVGIGTNNPVVRLHAVDGDTPTLRLEQDGSSGFAPQTWDVAGNETSFFVRDATNGSTLPFRIRPGAASNRLVVDSDGNIGMGVLSTGTISVTGADASAHIQRSDGNASLLIEETNGTSQGRIMLELKNNGGAQFALTNSGTGDIWKTLVNNAGNYAITLQGAASTLFLLDQSGNVTIPGGSMYNGSDVNKKRDIVPVDAEEILARVSALPLATWSWKGKDTSRHLGPMAQDFYGTFALGKNDTTISPMDMTGVALAAVQALAKQVESKDAELEELKAKATELDQLKAHNADLEARLAALEAQLKR